MKRYDASVVLSGLLTCLLVSAYGLWLTDGAIRGVVLGLIPIALFVVSTLLCVRSRNAKTLLTPAGVVSFVGSWLVCYTSLIVMVSLLTHQHGPQFGPQQLWIAVANGFIPPGVIMCLVWILSHVPPFTRRGRAR